MNTALKLNLSLILSDNTLVFNYNVPVHNVGYSYVTTLLEHILMSNSFVDNTVSVIVNSKLGFNVNVELLDSNNKTLFSSVVFVDYDICCIPSFNECRTPNIKDFYQSAYWLMMVVIVKLRENSAVQSLVDVISNFKS
jgi:hypothetical protein